MPLYLSKVAVALLTLSLSGLAGCSSPEEECEDTSEDRTATPLESKPTNPATLTACFTPRAVQVGEAAELRLALELAESSDHPLDFRQHVSVPAGLRLLSSPWWNGTLQPGQRADHAIQVEALKVGTWGVEVDAGDFSANAILRVT
jgi:hypothetical protein